MFESSVWRRRSLLPAICACLLLVCDAVRDVSAADSTPLSGTAAPTDAGRGDDGRKPTADAVRTGVIRDVSLGPDGLMKPGCWCRVRVSVAAESDCRVEVVTPDPIGHPVVYQSDSIDPGFDGPVDVFVKPGRLETTISVRLVDSARQAILDSRRFVSSGTPGVAGDFRVVRHSTPTALFCGGFSPGTAATGTDESSGRPPVLDELRAAGVAVSRVNPDDLPTDWRTLAVYRTLILSREFALSNGQSAALRQWVSQGGHLVVALGIGARGLAARTPAESIDAMLDLLDAGGLRDLRSQTLGSVLSTLSPSVAEGVRSAGQEALLDVPLDRLPDRVDGLKLPPDRTRSLRDALRAVHRELTGVAQERINQSLQNSPLGAWALGGSTLQAATLSDLTGLETLISSTWSIPVSARHWGSVISNDRARPLATGLEGTLLSRFSYGCGRITLCGVALDQSPIVRWKEVQTFLEALIDQPVEDSDAANDRRRISSSGIEELSTQLYAAVESISQVEPRSTLGLLGMTLLYLLLIGPADFYLVHRVLNRPQLTWVTFPLVVILAGLLGSASARSRNSDSVELHRLEILDLDQSSGFIRTTALTTVFSPQHARYRIAVPHRNLATRGGLPLVPSYIGWFGFPEANYTGMYRSAGVQTGHPQYGVSPDGHTFQNLPIAVWSDRVLHSESFRQGAGDLIESDLKRTGTGQLDRNSTFTHHLPFSLRNWILVHGNRVYYHDLRSGGLLDDNSIPPGQTWSPGDPTVTGREVRSFLTGAEFRFKEENFTSPGNRGYRKRLDKWDSRSTSLRDIVQMLTFHEIAGGRNYTGLNNFALQELELSEHVALGQAILVAEVDGPVSEPAIDDGTPVVPASDAVTTVVRILLPVTEAPIARTLPKFVE